MEKDKTFQSSPVIRIRHFNEWEKDRHGCLFIKPFVENVLQRMNLTQMPDKK
ncbi:MAG: hypothetical protein H6Q67_131 [Firmicutes bacterium]|nr:hypothetical protein [Bacillota bacterium]